MLLQTTAIMLNLEIVYLEKVHFETPAFVNKKILWLNQAWAHKRPLKIQQKTNPFWVHFGNNHYSLQSLSYGLQITFDLTNNMSFVCSYNKIRHGL